MRPINAIENRSSQTYKSIKIRPIHKSGINSLKHWFDNKDWSTNIATVSVDKKTELLLEDILQAVNIYLPEKNIRVASDDEPWFNEALKKLDRKRRREYNKNRRSPKYLALICLYQDKLSRQKKETQEGHD